MNFVLKAVFSSLIVVVLCAGCLKTNDLAQEKPTPDRSLASVFAETEFAFQRAKEKGDALGMARAAKERADILSHIETAALGKRNPTGISNRALLEQVISDAVRSMLKEARFAANGDEILLLRIERLFPATTPNQYGINSLGGGISGKLRKVEITVGLEIDVTLIPKKEYVARLPADSTTGTTIFVQPVGVYDTKIFDIKMEVASVTDGLTATPPSCDVSAKHGRLPCFLSPGKYSDVELRLVNHGSGAVNILIFVSGNEDIVRAVLEPQ